jgi:ClpP class serine protease
MKAQFVSRLLVTPWNIDKLRGRTIIANIAVKLLRSERPEEDICGDPLPKMQLVGNVALIPLTGIICINVPDWIKAWGFGLTDANDIAEEVDEALADPNVELIVYDCDSPGGMSIAGDKLFAINEAANKKKKVFAYCGDGKDMASTTYEAVASATALLAGPFADGVGCIGSYIAYLDDIEFWAKMGIKFEVFRSGELKGIGEDALTEVQAKYLQSLVDDSGASFRKNVLKYRTGIARADMEGQWFEGVEAARRGFVGGTAKDLNAAIAKFRKML